MENYNAVNTGARRNFTEKDLAAMLAQIKETGMPISVTKADVTNMIVNCIVDDIFPSDACYATNHICEAVMVARDESGEVAGAVYYLEYGSFLYGTTDRRFIEYIGKIPSTPRKLMDFTLRHISDIQVWKKFRKWYE